MSEPIRDVEKPAWRWNGPAEAHRSDGARMIQVDRRKWEMYEPGVTILPWIIQWDDETPSGFRSLVHHRQQNRPTASFQSMLDCADDVLARQLKRSVMISVPKAEHDALMAAGDTVIHIFDSDGPCSASMVEAVNGLWERRDAYLAALGTEATDAR